MVVPGCSVVGRLCLFQSPSKRFSVLSSGVPSWRSRPSGLGILGIDNLDIVRCVGRLLDCFSKPLPPDKDGDLIALVQRMILSWGLDTVKVTKVKGHATEADVEEGPVRLEDRLGIIEADTAADLGRRHQSEEALGGPAGPA